ncbi:Uncharacterised protein [uncultured Clostridium sp.]|uniref:serine hydrolase n=1 Tax=uncultured Clostridium sp. TaxID=59620 RepID=UPI000822EDF1|nr:serine hydrolase [uncultured Clostridium sp.]SCK04593.1 Uncharacterised protein [uncultured Clostridium sp.]
MLFKLLLCPLFFCLTVSNFNVNYEIEGEKFDKNIESIVGEIVDNYKDNIAIYYCNVDGSKEYYLNNDKRFIAASLTKVPQAMEVIDKINEGKLSLDYIIEYCEEDYEEGTGILKCNKEIGKITVEEALELSLKYSDNIANNMLNRICGYDINEYISKVTGEDITVGNLTTAREQGKIYYKLYSDDEYSLIIDLLKKGYCHDRIDKYLEYRKVAHKFGNYYRYFHDGGIIYDEKPYILVVLTKDIGKLSENLEEVECEDERSLIDGGEEAKELIAQVSKAINTYNIIKIKNMVK